METAQEVDVAAGSPGTGKGANFRIAGQTGPKWRGLKPLVTLGAGELWAEKRKAPMYEGGTHDLEIGSFDRGALEW